MEFIEPEMKQVAPKKGFDNTTEVKWNTAFVDKWQYHVKDLNEFLEIKRGILTIEFASVYELESITLSEGNSGVTPNLLVHRLKSNFPLTLECSFPKPWSKEQEPLFKTEEEAFFNFAAYLAGPYGLLD